MSIYILFHSGHATTLRLVSPLRCQGYSQRPSLNHCIVCGIYCSNELIKSILYGLRWPVSNLRASSRLQHSRSICQHTAMATGREVTRWAEGSGSSLLLGSCHLNRTFFSYTSAGPHSMRKRQIGPLLLPIMVPHSEHTQCLTCNVRLSHDSLVHYLFAGLLNFTVISFSQLFFFLDGWCAVANLSLVFEPCNQGNKNRKQLTLKSM